jgi:hypothetical protein
MRIHKIKFFHLNPALTELYPAVLGNDYTMDWVKNERKKWNAYNEKTKSEIPSILKCPGIFDMYSKGFFIQQPYDVLIGVKEDEIYVNTPDLSSLYENNQKIVFHKPNDIAVMPFREGTLPCMPNITTGFQLLSNVPLLILPVPYPDQYEWEGSMGILETYKSVEVKLQIYLNNYKGEKEKTWKINAGDNIMFVIPLTSDNWVIENKLTIKEKLWVEVHNMVMSRKNLCPMSNSTNYSTILPEIKKRMHDIFKKLWRGKE